jgi:uncharacterized membrane protein
MKETAMSIAIAGLWILALVCVATTYCAAAGKLRRNQIAGIRIPTTMASDAAWRAGHRAAMPFMWLTVPVAVVGTAVIATMKLGPLVALVVGALPIVLIAILIAAAVVAGKAARRV